MFAKLHENPIFLRTLQTFSQNNTIQINIRRNITRSVLPCCTDTIFIDSSEAVSREMRVTATSRRIFGGIFRRRAAAAKAAYQTTVFHYLLCVKCWYLLKVFGINIDDNI